MQHLEVSVAVRPIKWSLGVKWLKEGNWYVQHNYLLLCMVESSMLHVSTLHAGHLQAFTKNMLGSYHAQQLRTQFFVKA